MSIGKIIALVVFGGLAWQHQAAVRQHASFVVNLPAILQTQIEMESFRSPVAIYLNDNFMRWPADLPQWLRDHFSGGVGDLGSDSFDELYEADYDERDGLPILRSCGPDRECWTDDDLVMRIFRPKKVGDTGDDYGRSPD